MVGGEEHGEVVEHGHIGGGDVGGGGGADGVAEDGLDLHGAVEAAVELHGRVVGAHGSGEVEAGVDE